MVPTKRLLVSGTLTLVAIHNENFEVAILSVALAGSLAGFLLFNWHPACIFLGDSGSLLIGLLIAAANLLFGYKFDRIGGRESQFPPIGAVTPPPPNIITTNGRAR